MRTLSSRTRPFAGKLPGQFKLEPCWSTFRDETGGLLSTKYWLFCPRCFLTTKHKITTAFTCGASTARPRTNRLDLSFTAKRPERRAGWVIVHAWRVGSPWLWWNTNTAWCHHYTWKTAIQMIFCPRHDLQLVKNQKLALTIFLAWSFEE